MDGNKKVCKARSLVLRDARWIAKTEKMRKTPWMVRKIVYVREILPTIVFPEKVSLVYEELWQPSQQNFFSEKLPSVVLGKAARRWFQASPSLKQRLITKSKLNGREGKLRFKRIYPLSFPQHSHTLIKHPKITTLFTIVDWTNIGDAAINLGLLKTTASKPSQLHEDYRQTYYRFVTSVLEGRYALCVSYSCFEVWIPEEAKILGSRLKVGIAINAILPDVAT